MAKDKLTQYDTTASNNTDVGGVSVAEGMLPSGVNNAIREQMSHLADFAAGTSGVDVLKLQDDTDTNSIKLQAPSSVTTTTTFTLPDGDGESGQTMITDGAGTLAWAAPYGNRNLIINGAMQVAQRGTSETGVSISQYVNACDRFKVNGNNGTWTISQDTDAPDGFSNSLKMLLTATETIGTTSYWSVEQKIEGQNLQSLAYGTSSAKTVTVSFYVKSNITGTYCLNLYQDDGTKNFPKTYTIDSADTWEYKTISFVGDTSTALDNDNASSLRTQFFVVAGSDLTSGSSGSRVAYSNATFAAGHTAQVDAVNDYWQITGVQLELGEQATPFEHRSYGDELARCQRYFHAIELTSAWFIDAYLVASSYCIQAVPFATTMRVSPTSTADMSTNWITSNLTSNLISVYNANYASWQIRASGAGRSYAYYNANDGATIKFDAEL